MSEPPQMPPQLTKDTSPAITLSGFIDQNQKLISVLGVFTALTVFSGQLRLRFLSDLLSFLFLAATVILWFELQEKFPRKSSSRKLGLFEDCVGFAVVVLVVYWVLMYRLLWRQLLVIGLYFVLTSSVRKLLQRRDAFNRIFSAGPDEKKWLRRALYYAIQAAIIVTCLIVSALVGVPVNRWLDSARLALERDTSQRMTSPIDSTIPQGAASAPKDSTASSTSGDYGRLKPTKK